MASMPTAGTADSGSRTTRGVMAFVRIVVAFLWIQNAAWKIPPDFGERSGGGLYHFTNYAVEYPVLGPFAWLVEHVVLPNFVLFGWLTLLVEAGLGAFLLIGLATRLWAVLGVVQSSAIALSVLYAPNEWHWSYYLMILVHLALFATAAGRGFGLDGVFRPIMVTSRKAVARGLARLA